ncbi:hypothetical protein [Hoeflea sp. TYP-13]|uniref:hypothetical protein n=1 Tax=Hoeflea sp. TYP-13 TaxID=3230023 RepID=UPI0034C63309
MGVIIELNSRLASRRPKGRRRNTQRESASILVFTGVRYEEKKQEKKRLIADQTRGGKL